MSALARTETPRGEVSLHQDGPRLVLRVNGVYVMDTAETSTEEALAEVALSQVADPRNVLIGGLGLGFTARAVLDDARVERCVVVEIEGPLIDWMRDGTVPHGPALLADRRLDIKNLDIALAIDEAREGQFDLILLDVDNGPDNLVHSQNAAIYADPFLAKVRRATARGGVAVIWSAAESPALEQALGTAFETVTVLEHAVDLQGRAERYYLYLGSGV